MALRFSEISIWSMMKLTSELMSLFACWYFWAVMPMKLKAAVSM